MISLDYPLQVQDRKGRIYGHFRAWAIDSAIDEADSVASLTGRICSVVDLRVHSRVVYDTKNGHANWVPEGSVIAA